MSILKDIVGSFSSRTSRDPYMQLAKDMPRKQSVILDLTKQTEALTKKDVKAWHDAWQMALNHEEPRRANLYDVYTNAMIDNHLSGCILQRKGRTLQKDFVILGKNSKEDLKLKKLFENEWFSQFINLALDSIFWGHSLIQLGDVLGRGADVMRFENCTLVPRKHVVPEFGVITKEVGGDIYKGVSYRDGDIADWCVEVGNPNSLGALLKVAPQCLSKKNMLAYWDVFGEIFGMPMRVATTASRDPKDWAMMSNMLNKLGAAGWGLFPQDTSIDIKETSRGDAYNVYDKRVERCNSEISKAILAQTMTIDNGSSLSQSSTHLDVFNCLCQGDATELKYTINNRLLPLMEKHGFPVSGCAFEWDNAASYTPAERREMERLLLQEYDIDPQYFINNYKIPIIGKKSPEAIQTSQQKSNDGKATTKLSRPDDFFA